MKRNWRARADFRRALFLRFLTPNRSLNRLFTEADAATATVCRSGRCGGAARGTVRRQRVTRAHPSHSHGAKPT